MPKRVYRSDQIHELLAEYERTHSVADASAASGVCVPSAYRILSQVGIFKAATPQYKTALRRRAVDLYRKGLSCRAIEKAFRSEFSPAPSRAIINDWVKSAGVVRTRSRADELMNARLNGRDYDQMRKRVLYLATEKLWSIRRIANELGVSRNFVARAVPRSYHCDPAEATERRAWQAFHPDVERRRAKRDLVVTLRERGLTYPQITEKTGVSKAMVYRYCRLAGLTKQIMPRRRLEVAA